MKDKAVSSLTIVNAARVITAHFLVKFLMNALIPIPLTLPKTQHNFNFNTLPTYLCYHSPVYFNSFRDGKLWQYVVWFISKKSLHIVFCLSITIRIIYWSS